MIITRAPFRVSFFGGGSDLASFYEHRRGAVLSAAINKYMYISTHRYYQKNRFSLKYSATENVGSLDEVKHPLLREILKKYRPPVGIEISSVADIPAGTGLGSSSAFTVAAIHNLLVRSSRNCTKQELAEMACHIEIDVLKEPIGKQDQYASAFGSINVFEFLEGGQVLNRQLTLNPEHKKALRDHLLLFYSGITRPSSEVLSEQKKNMESRGPHLKTLEQMVDLVAEGEKSIHARDFRSLGRLLHESWLMKKSLASKISNGPIDEIYAKARAAGAVGGKLLGAGGGGFLLFVAAPETHDNVRAALSGTEEIKFSFDEEGAKVLFYGEENEQ